MEIINVVSSGQITGFHRGDEDIRTFKEILAEVFEGIIEEGIVEIHAVIPNNVVVPELKPDTLQIHMWNRTDPIRRYQPDITALYGFTQIFKTGFFQPSGGDTILSPEGVALAEYYQDEKVLVLLFDAIHTVDGFTDAPAVFRAMMEEFANVHYSSGTAGKLTKEELAAKREQAKAEAKKKAIIKMLNKMVKAKVDNTTKALAKHETDIKQCQEVMLLALRNSELMRKELALYTLSESDAQAKMQKEFDGLTDVKAVLDYEISGDWLIITTDYLCTEVGGNYYLMGRYKIHINVNTSEIKFMNQDASNRRYSIWGESCQHPHVAQLGNACLGNAAETIVQLVSQNEWCALAGFLVNYCESVNVQDSAGRYFVNWDMINKEDFERDGTRTIIRKGLNTHSPGAIRQCHKCGREIDTNTAGFKRCGDCEHFYCSECAKTEIQHVKNSSGTDRDICMPCITRYYIKCAGCGELHYIENLHTCKTCKQKVCETCSLSKGSSRQCKTCDKAEKEAKKVVSPPVPVVPATTCIYCGRAIAPTDQYTCEVCGTQGCSSCVHEGEHDGRAMYLCPTHR